MVHFLVSRANTATTWTCCETICECRPEVARASSDVAGVIPAGLSILVSKTEWLNFPVPWVGMQVSCPALRRGPRQCAFVHSVVEVAGVWSV